MRYATIMLAGLILLFAMGCSGSGVNTPVTPGDMQRPASAISDSHHIWGLWQFTANPQAGTLDVVPLRTADMHVNVVPLLEPPAGAKLKISNLVFNGLICDVDVTLIHPFPGLSQYIGFDVAGIFISKGILAGYSDPNLIMAGPSETRLLNPDGYTRWWNPSEFGIAGQPIFRYKDGLLGNKNSTAHFNCTLNGYKLFGDDLTKEQDLLTLTPKNRVPFMDGSSNTRHYKIDFNGGVVFNYAVDANWELPGGSTPFTLDDYPPSANRPEAWAASITEIENKLYNDGTLTGGSLKLKIDVWDHYGADLNKLLVESPGNFDPVVASTPVGGGEGFSTYEVDIPSATPKPGSIDLLIQATSEAKGYLDVLPDDYLTAYFVHTSLVSAVGQFPPVALMQATTSTSINAGQTVSFDASASTGTPPLTFTWDFNGDGTYGDTYTGTADKPTHQFDDIGTFNVTVKVTNVKGFDISDPVAVKVGLDPTDTYVDADYTGGGSDGSMAKPFLTIQQGMAAVLANHKIHVDYRDTDPGHTYDTASLTLKNNVTLMGDNWNGGGPGKPRLANSTNASTISNGYGSISNFTIDGFQMSLGKVTASALHYGVNIYNGTSIVVRHCKFTDTIDDTGITGGFSCVIYLSNSTDSTVEYNEVGPITWHSDTAGEYARCLLGIDVETGKNVVLRNNFIHDWVVDYQGDGLQWGQIRTFCLHCYNCIGAEVNNNLICHIKGINTYDYRIEGLMIEGSGDSDYHYYNNTVDNLDHSQSNGNFPLRGLFCYSMNAPGTYVNNTLMTYFYTPASQSGSIQAYYSVSALNYPLTYSTGYKLGSIGNYFNGFGMGNGNVNAPGVDPKYVNNTTAPYNYHFAAGSECEMGDPNFIDWDDTGAPSGNPGEPNIQNRSRMGCFGGPDGDWDPNSL